MSTELINKVTATARSLGISALGVRAVESLSLDPHGIDREAAPSMLASSLDVTLAESQAVLLELASRQVVLENAAIPPRLEVDLRRMGLTQEEIVLLKARRTVFVNHGAPHSQAAMDSLDGFFRNTTGPIFVALGITAPKVFRALGDRCKSGRRTTFLMPRKVDVPDRHKVHYGEILNEWVRLFREDDPKIRRNADLRITDVDFPDLHTSAPSQDVARFDIYFLDTGTTRDGDILEVKKGTSLYHAIAARYEEAIFKSRPIWRVWWFRAFLVSLRRFFLLPLALLVVGWIFAGTTNAYAAVASTVALGVLANILYSKTKFEAWYRHKLFGK